MLVAQKSPIAALSRREPNEKLGKIGFQLECKFIFKQLLHQTNSFHTSIPALMKPYLFLFLFFSLIQSQLNAQFLYEKPDYGVKFLSYFGIGSESVQKPSILGYDACHYALIQRESELVEQGLGVPVCFYNDVLTSSGAKTLIEQLQKEYTKLKDADLEKHLSAIEAKIKSANISTSLINQLRNGIDEFYKGKAIRIMSSPNYIMLNKCHTVLDNYTSTCSNIKNLATALKEHYSLFWSFAAFKNRVEHKLANKELAIGLVITGEVQDVYAHNAVRTIYKDQSTTPSIFIKSTKEQSVEQIAFRQFDSKWYVTLEKGKTSKIFVDNAPLTPIARQIQSTVAELDPILKNMHLGFTEKAAPYDYVVHFTFAIIKQGTAFKLRLVEASFGTILEKC